MTIGRIGGPMLKENLVRQGVDLAFETDLVYLDVNNMRVGINQSVPTADLDVLGITKLANIEISNNTITSNNANGNINLAPNGTGNVLLNTAAANQMVYAGPNKELLTSSAFTFDGATVGITSADIVTMLAGDIEISTDTITNVATNGNINLNPNGTGNVIIDTAGANQIFYAGVNKEIITDSNLSFDGSTLTISGVANIDNIQIDGNTISSTDSNGDITLDPDGTGFVNVDYLTAGRVVYAGASGSLIDSANLTFDGTDLYVSGLSVVGGSGTNLGNISISNNTIASTDSNGNIYLDPNGTGRVAIVGTNAITIPVGTTLERPTGAAGDLRLNTSTNSVEFYNGTSWLSLASSSTTISSDQFQGDGSTTNFTLSESATTDSVLVAINGVMQTPGDSYTASGTTLSFVEAPLTGDRIDVRFIASTTVTSALQDIDTQITVDGAADRANVTVGGNLVMQITDTAVLPGANVTYDLGSSSMRWKDLWLSGTTVRLGSVVLKDTDGSLAVLASDGVTPANIAGASSTGNITFTTATMSTSGTNQNITLAPNGTGNVLVSTNLNASGNVTSPQFISNIATGTAPFVVTSTTQVANLNVANAGHAATADSATTATTATTATSATSATTAGTVTTAAQPNITSVGTLSALTVQGNITGNSSLTISNDALIQGDMTVEGNLAVLGQTINTNSNDLIVTDSLINLHASANLEPLIVDDGRDIGSIFHYYKTSYKKAFVGWDNNTSELRYYVDATDTGGMITGQLGNMRANVFISNIATGTAPFIVTSTTQVANLNVANAGTAGTVATAAQPNITSVGTLTALDVNAQANATVFSSNVATGTAPFIVTSTTQVANLNVANAGYATSAGSASTATTAGTVTTASQPNITGLGTLTSLNVNAQANATIFRSNIATGTAPFIVTSTTQVANLNVANAGYAVSAGSASTATSANYATSAGSAGYATSAGSATSATSATTATSAGSATTFTSTTQNSRFNSIGIGTNASGTTGEIRATNDITAFYSDARLKSDIQPISNALEKVKQINGVTYVNSDLANEFGFNSKNRMAGVLAHEIEAVLPEVVTLAPFDMGDTDENGNITSLSGENYKTVKYDKLVPLLIEAIKDLSNQVEELKKKVN